MIELRLNGLSFQLESATEIQNNLSFWNSPLTYSTIAMALTKGSQPYYVFANAREARNSGALTSVVAWGTSQDQVEVVFDSTGYHQPGTRLNGQVLMRAYQVLLVKRI